MDVIQNLIESISWDVIIGTSVRVLLILIIGLALMSATKLLLTRLEARLITQSKRSGENPGEATKRIETLIRLVRQGIRVVLWMTILLVVLKELGVDVAPILASAGVVGLAVGFGAQNLVRDVISGFFFIMENQVRVGDVAIINGTGGLVERMNFRTITLRDLGGVVHVFPNGNVNTLSNLTRDWSAYLMDIGVAYKEDPDHVIEIMREVGAELREDPVLGQHMLGDIEIFGVDKFGDSAVTIKARIRTLPIRQWDVGREYLKRLKRAFDEAGVEIPFPHRTLYFGEASKPIALELAERARRQREVADDDATSRADFTTNIDTDG